MVALNLMRLMLSEGRFSVATINSKYVLGSYIAITSLTKRSSKRQIEGGGVMGFKEKQVFYHYYFDTQFGFRAYSAFFFCHIHSTEPKKDVFDLSGASRIDICAKLGYTSVQEVTPPPNTHTRTHTHTHAHTHTRTHEF